MFFLRNSGVFLILAGLSFVILRLSGLLTTTLISNSLQIFLIFGLPFIGSIFLFAARSLLQPASVDNNRIHQTGFMQRGWIGWLIGLILTCFYIIIYFGHDIKIITHSDAPQGNDSLHHFFTSHVYSLLDPLSYALNGDASSNWFFYSSMYTYVVLLFGIRMLFKYRHIPYHIWRTFSLVFVQLGLAYILPNVLRSFQQPEFYFSYFWPLKPEYFYPQTWAQTYGIGVYFLLCAAAMSFIATPILTYLYGKRWYCSWVCGCGALAETMGDPFRQLSNKSLAAWKLERWSVYSILVFISLITVLLWINSFGAGAIFGSYSHSLQKSYGFFIGAIFSGVIGVGFYPLLGTRVWCRFGCPMAAILGILQRFFSRFRITTNGGQCISCGNCSTYCEMGIDVRHYAQRSQDILRASCVGCGICAAVCPRGVLKLENGKVGISV